VRERDAEPADGARPRDRLRRDARLRQPGVPAVDLGAKLDGEFRGQVEFETSLRSDTRAVLPLVDRLLDAAGAGVRWMRDPTRGGVATALSELVRDTGLGAVIHEDRIPIRDEVRGICELLGLDPLHIANEGQFIAVVDPAVAEAAREALRRTPGGEAAAIIGEVRAVPARAVIAMSPHGGARAIDMLVGDPLPRIC